MFGPSDKPPTRLSDKMALFTYLNKRKKESRQQWRKCRQFGRQVSFFFRLFAHQVA